MRSVLFSVIAMSLALTACGSSSKKSTDNSSTATKYTWATDIAPIVKTNCTDAGCHGKGTNTAGGQVYEDNETNFKAEKAVVKDYMNRASTDAEFMPRGKTIPAADKQKILDFLAQ